MNVYECMHFRTHTHTQKKRNTKVIDKILISTDTSSSYMEVY